MKAYWKTTLADAAALAASATKAQVRTVGHSAGGREIYLFFYGKKPEFARTANYSSALGARRPACYADKSAPDYRPCVFLAGGIHGAEFEGSMAAMNLIQILETGKDFAGTKHPALQKAAEAVNLMIVPFCNPDGRARVPFDTMVGKSFAQLRYYDQGTWKDGGKLCGWPACKKVHPIKAAADFLGGYYNDDGINLMHDHPFLPMAEETKILYRLMDEYVPDFTVLLHGGDNALANYILKPAYAPAALYEKISAFEEAFAADCAAQNMRFTVPETSCAEEMPSFNLLSALTHICGEMCVTYETNQGLCGMENPPFTEEEIYLQHLALFQKMCEFVLESK